jgi:hypothetical protein
LFRLGSVEVVDQSDRHLTPISPENLHRAPLLTWKKPRVSSPGTITFVTDPRRSFRGHLVPLGATTSGRVTRFRRSCGDSRTLGESRSRRSNSPRSHHRRLNDHSTSSGGVLDAGRALYSKKPDCRIHVSRRGQSGYRRSVASAAI